jgi:large subunit ribosomal protein L21
MTQAVVKIGKSQYLVNPGMEIDIDRQSNLKGTVAFEEVYLVIDEKSVQVGQPLVSGVSVKAKVLGEKKGEKIRVSKFKAKSRYRKTTGFRPVYTKILIEEISKKTEVVPGVEVKKAKKVTKAKTSEK